MPTHSLLVLGALLFLVAACGGAQLFSRPDRSSWTVTVLGTSWTAVPLLLGGVLAIGLAVSAFSLASVPANSSAETVTLPVEVIGDDQTTKSIVVNASDVSDVDSLYLRAYSIGYPYYKDFGVNKASIRLNNGGSWVDLTDDIANCKFPESKWECIDGPYHTIRFEVAVSDLGTLRDGENIISFRFNYAYPSDSPNSHGAVSSGYRILDLEFRTQSDADAIDGTSFVWDDPGSWEPPSGYDNQTAISEGSSLWKQRDILVDGWNGPEIRASCADCHTEDGRDLKYFAFSNESIVERAKFHDLSAEQGKQIAAYIRSRVLKDPDTGTTYEAPGRPWAPPYQPGPTARGTRADGAPRTDGESFSDVSSQLWAAGAGVDWALDTDEQMWPYVKGEDGTFGYEDVAVDSTLNMRQLPVNLQFPDWNEWLPEHHPIDLFGSTFENGYSGDTDPNSAYTDDVGALEDCLANNGGDASNCGDAYFDASIDMYWGARRFQQEIQRDNISPIAPYTDVKDAKLASIIMSWQAVKQWEFVHQHDLADEGQHWQSNVEDLTWISDARQVFDIPPHISGSFAGSQYREFDLYLDNAWYQLQATINSGRGIGTGIRPTDWRYQVQHIKEVNKQLGMAHSMRLYTSFVKVNQNCDVEGYYADDSAPRLWFFRRGHCDFGALMFRYDWVYPEVNQVTGGGGLDAYEELLRANFRGFGKHPKDEWSRQYGEKGWEPEGFTPSLDHSWGDDDQTPSHYYKTLDRMEQMGGSPALLSDIAEWGEAMNPNGNWEQWIDDSATQRPTITLTRPTDGASLRGPTDLVLDADASDEDGTIETVTFYNGPTKIAEVTSPPYTTTWSDVAPGTYRIKAQATDDAGATTTTPASYVTVGTADAPSTGVNYAYFEGEWSGLPFFRTLRAKTTGTTSQFGISERQRDNNFGLHLISFVKVPPSEEGTYTFYTTSDDESQLIVDGKNLISNDWPNGEKSRTIVLSAGWHRIVVEYIQGSGGKGLSVSWKGPSVSKEEIPADRLHQAPVLRATQTLRLDPGWDVISSDVAPASAPMDSVFAGAAVEVVKDEDGAVYVPTEDRNEIGAWDSTEAYKVYTESQQSITMRGSAVETTTALPLQEGWNLVSYLPDEPQPVDEALASIRDELVIVKDEDGNTYIPAYGIDEIGQLTPGNGYQVYVDTPVDLTYPSSSKRLSAPATSALDE